MRSIVTALLMLCTTGALAQQAKEIKTVKGRAVGLLNLINQSADCKMGSVRIPNLSEPPKHGSIQMLAGNANIPATGNCPAHVAPIIALVYIPARDFTGSDSAKIEIITDDRTTSFSYAVLVQAAENKH